MKKLSCLDLELDCGYVALALCDEDVLNQSIKHLRKRHPELLNNSTLVNYLSDTIKEI